MKIIFLDIDGPIINTPLYYINPMVSFRRTHMNTAALGWISFLCKKTGAKIVCNSSHNYHHVDNLDERDLKSDLCTIGRLDPDWFHPKWRTTYPYSRGEYRRSAAILDWLDENKDPEVVSWVAFDDDWENFSEHHQINNLAKVVFEEGITTENALRAYHILMGEPFPRYKFIV
jgi:HAD domain in Swiss Army Knife RNA repair proteins